MVITAMWNIDTEMMYVPSFMLHKESINILFGMV